MNNGNSNKFSIASLCCGVISFFVFPYIFGIAAIILGIIAISNQEEKKSYGLSGIIIGIIGMLWVFFSANL